MIAIKSSSYYHFGLRKQIKNNKDESEWRLINGSGKTGDIFNLHCISLKLAFRDSLEQAITLLADQVNTLKTSYSIYETASLLPLMKNDKPNSRQ